MVGYVCTVASGKGGVGKTTTVLNVGALLAAKDYDVVVVDADLGMANLAGMLGVEHDGSVHDVLAGGATVSDALHVTDEGLSIVPGEKRLEAFAEADPAKLRTVIKTLRNAHDAVIVDTGSGLSHETAVPLGLSDGIVLTTTPDDVAVDDAKKTAQLAEQVDGEVVGALVTQATTGTDIEAIESELDYPLLGAIPADVEATETEPLVLHSQDSDAADAYEQLTDILEAEFFDGDRGDTQLAYDPAWFGDEPGTADGDGDDGDDDGGGYVRGIFGGG